MPHNLGLAAYAIHKKITVLRLKILFYYALAWLSYCVFCLPKEETNLTYNRLDSRITTVTLRLGKNALPFFV